MDQYAAGFTRESGAESNPRLGSGQARKSHVQRGLQSKRNMQSMRSGDVEPQSRLESIILGQGVETLGGIVVAINFVAMTLESNARAVNEDGVLQVCEVANNVLFVYYFVECGLRAFVLRWQFFHSYWNLIDLTVVTVGFLDVASQMSNLDKVSGLKILRMLRLLRLAKLFAAFRELYVLVAGVGRCMRTLFWAVILILIVLNVWSIISVEYLREYVDEVANNEGFPNCDWCASAFSSVWKANVAWFQVAAGDGWSLLCQPLMARHFWIYFFFLLNIVFVTWGLLNLIVSAVLEAAMEARMEDVHAAAEMARCAQKNADISFRKLCRSMDNDGDGTITIDEFKETWKKSEELQEQLTCMGVREKDMDGLLRLMDADENGVLDHDEFIEQFTNMRTHVMQTTTFYLLQYIHRIQDTLKENTRVLQVLSGETLEDVPASEEGFADVKMEVAKPNAADYDSRAIAFFPAPRCSSRTSGNGVPDPAKQTRERDDVSPPPKNFVGRGETKGKSDGVAKQPKSQSAIAGPPTTFNGLEESSVWKSPGAFTLSRV